MPQMSQTSPNKPVEERIGKMLRQASSERKLTLSAAESCTGGRISHLLTKVSGSSAYYLGSVTSYAVSVKEKVLGVPESVISESGVVSSQVAAAMAEGVRSLTGSTFSVSTTGLAEGGDNRYPEGTVWMAVSGPMGTRTEIFHCNLGRKRNIKRFAVQALEFLASYISEYLNN